MNIVDIDVIAKGGKKDLVIKAFGKELRKQQATAMAFGVSDQKKLVEDVTEVFDMIDRIISSAGHRRIRRLRIFGHGSDSTVQIGPFSRTGRRVSDVSRGQRIDQADLNKVIQVIQRIEQTPAGRTVKVEYKLLSEGYLNKLKGRFEPGGWVELHSCRIAGVDGKNLITALAKLWQVEVHASENKQYVGGGLDGRVWIAKPSGRLLRKSPQQQAAFGIKGAPRTFQARYNPLREAVHRLQRTPLATGNTAPEQPPRASKPAITRCARRLTGYREHRLPRRSSAPRQRRTESGYRD